ncbi:MAG: ABC transporter ATP-binding protein [Alphaproteobacteria bacterium]
MTIENKPPRTLIEASALSKSFGAVQALSDISFKVEEGQFVTIVGPSGCGKSTLLQILAGLTPATSGQLTLEGVPISGPNPDKIGVVFQDSWLLPWKSAIENIEFPLSLRGMSAKERRARAQALLDLVGLKESADRYPHELSGGMKQRIAIARGLVQEPRVLLMDEPFAALDEQTRTRMGNELLQIWQRSRPTVVFITHGLTEAIYLADVVMVMGARPGRILERIEVDLPRPRNIDMIGSESFGRLRNKIWHMIAGE